MLLWENKVILLKALKFRQVWWLYVRTHFVVNIVFSVKILRSSRWYTTIKAVHSWYSRLAMVLVMVLIMILMVVLALIRISWIFLIELCHFWVKLIGYYTHPVTGLTLIMKHILICSELWDAFLNWFWFLENLRLIFNKTFVSMTVWFSLKCLFIQWWISMYFMIQALMFFFLLRCSLLIFIVQWWVFTCFCWFITNVFYKEDFLDWWLLCIVKIGGVVLGLYSILFGSLMGLKLNWWFFFFLTGGFFNVWVFIFFIVQKKLLIAWNFIKWMIINLDFICHYILDLSVRCFSLRDFLWVHCISYEHPFF